MCVDGIQFSNVKSIIWIIFVRSSLCEPICSYCFFKSFSPLDVNGGNYWKSSSQVKNFVYFIMSLCFVPLLTEVACWGSCTCLR